ncbi:MAG: KOW domain-containing RNA-binding protein [Clostridia bacterium]|nr:KOW domain-containing RNA-binding protein [Clostridia bacterium]
MSFTRGQVVRSLAGRDKGSFLVVVAVGKTTLSLCDGKARPLHRPKQKNQKHIGNTNHRLTEEQMKTNKQIRHALRDILGAGQPQGGD